MSMSNDEWRAVRRDANRFGRLGAGWLIVIVVLVALMGIGTWAFKVATSDVKGKGDAVVVKNDAKNRIAAQERFEERYQDILATDRKIDVAAEALAADPENPTLKTNYTGTVTYCLDIVGKYNADARKYTAEAFRAEDLPAVIDNEDPATDCKENEK